MSLKERLYELVIEESETALIQQVNERMAHGWEPLGGPAVFIRNNDDTQAIMQAMVSGKPKS